MAGLKRCLGIDLGSSRIKVAEVALDKGTLRLLKVLHAEVDIVPGTDEDERAVRLSRALRDLLKANKITTKDAVFCVPGHAVFQRPVKLPKTSADRLRRIIEYEARQQIPFPLEQTRFEYQVFEDPQNEEEVEVLLAAIKRESIQSQVRLFRRAGLRIAGIGVSYFALLNYHLLDQGQVRLEARGEKKAKAEKKVKDRGKKASKKLSFGKKKKKDEEAPEPEPEPESAEDIPPPEDEEGIPDLEESLEDLEDYDAALGMEEVRAYVNLGATTMDLAIPKPGAAARVGFCRTIPHAGNEMTKAVQAALSLDSFREAEEIKQTQGAVLSTMFDLQAGGEDNFNRKACEALTQVVDRRIIGELRRSLDFYISQPDGVAVDALVLSGGQARLPYLASYVEEKLGIPVEVVDELHNEQVAMGDGTEGADFGAAALAIGLALQGVGVSPLQVDFLPTQLRTVREFKGHYREVAAMVAVLGGMIYFSADVGGNRIRQYEEATDEVRAIANPAAGEAIQQFNAIEAERQPWVDRTQRIMQLAEPRDIWLQFLAELARKPSEIVLNEVWMYGDGRIIISGEGPGLGPILEFQDQLNQRTDLIRDLERTYLDPQNQPDPLNRFQGGTRRFQFEMRHARKHDPTRVIP